MEVNVNKRITNKQITGRLDRYARELCHIRHGWKCCGCGSGENLHWAHIVQRFGHKAIRWSPHNSITLCKTCHKWYDTKATARQQYLLVERVSPASFDWLEEVDGGVPRNEKLFDMTINDMVLLADNIKKELEIARGLQSNKNN